MEEWKKLILDCRLLWIIRTATVTLMENLLTFVALKDFFQLYLR